MHILNLTSETELAMPEIGQYYICESSEFGTVVNCIQCWIFTLFILPASIICALYLRECICIYLSPEECKRPVDPHFHRRKYLLIFVVAVTYGVIQGPYYICRAMNFGLFEQAERAIWTLDLRMKLANERVEVFQHLVELAPNSTADLSFALAESRIKFAIAEEVYEEARDKVATIRCRIQDDAQRCRLTVTAAHRRSYRAMVRLWKAERVSLDLIPKIEDHIDELLDYHPNSSLFEQAERIFKMIESRSAAREPANQLLNQEAVEDARDELSNLRCLASRGKETTECRWYETRDQRKLIRAISQSFRLTKEIFQGPKSLKKSLTF